MARKQASASRANRAAAKETLRQARAYLTYISDRDRDETDDQLAANRLVIEAEQRFKDAGGRL